MVKENQPTKEEIKMVRLSKIHQGSKVELILFKLKNGEVEGVNIAPEEFRKNAGTIIKNIELRGVPTSDGAAFPRDGQAFLQGLLYSMKDPNLYAEPYQPKTS